MPKSNLHFLSHEKKLSCNTGELVPIGLLEVLPGDSIQHATSALIRTQPLLAPVMHKVDVTIHHWFVPMRLVWDEWEDFITGGPQGTSAPTFPTIESPSVTGYDIGTLADYLGVPTGVPNLQMSALPFRAYQLIWNNFYRDEDLQTEATFSAASGVDITTSRDLQRGCWEKDYFTSARPYPQKGSDVIVPLTGDARVTGIGKRNQTYPDDGLTVYETDGTSTTTYTSGAYVDGTNWVIEEDPTNAGYPNIRADLSSVSAVDIDTLTLASAIQRYKQNLMRGGSRYFERLANAFGVRPQDARLQLPEYLGGGREVIQFSEVLQTAEGTDPVGQMAGHGIAAMRSNKYRRFVPEHGYIISLLCVRPKTNYVDGLPRTWNRRTKEDFFQPELAHVGQQELLNKEVYAAHSNPDGTFGYQDRYMEYKTQESTIAGEFRDTLKFWHLAREFTSDPALNASFVSATPRNDIYAVTSADQLYIKAMHSVQAKRKVPKSGRSFLY